MSMLQQYNLICLTVAVLTPCAPYLFVLPRCSLIVCGQAALVAGHKHKPGINSSADCCCGAADAEQEQHSKQQSQNG